VEVVEGDEDGLARRQRSEQLAGSAVDTNAVFGRRGGGVPRGKWPHRRKGGGELVDLLLVEAAEDRPRRRLEEAVECVDEEPEWHLPLELGGAPVQDHAALA
jgi:hypothetical protein